MRFFDKITRTTAGIFGILATCICCNIQVLFSQPVTLDLTFGENGITKIYEASEVKFLDVDKKGNLIILGTTFVSPNSHLTIVKTNADGKLDRDFGENGIVRLKGYHRSCPYGMKITKENKIFMYGEAYKTEWGGRENIFLQFNEDGSLDETFGENGKIIVPFNFGGTKSTNLEHDDFILNIEGLSVFKYNYQGKMDVSFGENGNAYLPYNENFKFSPMFIKILRDQSIFLAGYESSNSVDPELAFCKLSPTGKLDTDFANHGVWKMNIWNSVISEPEYFLDAIEDIQGNIIQVGNAGTMFPGQFPFICSFSHDGTLNSSFGNYGQHGFYYPCHPVIFDKIFLNESKYIVMGNRAGQFAGALLSITSNGNTDTTFADNGYFFLNDFLFNDIKFQGTHKLVVGGRMLLDLNGKSIFALARINISPELSIKQFDKPTHSLTIFPSPVKDYLYFSEEKQFEIINLQGQVLLERKTPAKAVNISHLKDGIYLIKFDDNQVKKILKIR